MSRLTSAQVISLGEYLNPDFDPASLTVSQLLGVLGFHNINYPSPYTKPKLIQVFRDEIVPRAATYRRERIKKENSIASDHGITDGLTGRPIGGQTVTPAVRRSSRRLSRAPPEEYETPVTRPEPPKRRRSSAQPNLGGPSRTKAAPFQPALAEESEPEEDELPIRKIGRSKKTSEAAGSQARRVSQPDPQEDSGWEDNNIFQSGAESSSPLRPSPSRPKTTRKIVAPRKSRKSASAPPQLLDSPTRPSRVKQQEEELIHSPPRSKFEPELPSIVTRETRAFTAGVRRRIFPLAESEDKENVPEEDLGRDELDFLSGDGDGDKLEGLPEESESVPAEEVPSSEVGEDELDPSSAILERISEGGKELRRRPAPALPSEHKFLPRLFRTLLGVSGLIASVLVLNYKMESSPIGYCDTGSNTNNALEELKGKWNAIEACNRENRTLLYLPPLSVDSSRAGKIDGEDGDLTPCPLLPLVPVPHPTTCTPCPEHGTCSQFSVTCDTGYLLRSHPIFAFLPASSSPRNASISLSSSPMEVVWKVISEVTDGLPGFGSVGLPPRCVEDPKRKRNIGVLGKAVESVLAKERGQRICDGEQKGDAFEDNEGGQARAWGTPLETLRDTMKKRTPPHLLPTFDDTFNEAVQQLIQWGGVIIGEDSAGRRYLAHRTPEFTLTCAATVKMREIWAEWRLSVFGALVTLASALLARKTRAKKQIESKRVAELVQIALDTLRHQEFAHHTDPVTTPQAYLSSLQLRDLILQDEHSISARTNLWNQVERVVEGNANVRANLQELPTGDEMRVWRWVGSAGRGPGVQKRVKPEGEGGQGEVEA